MRLPPKERPPPLLQSKVTGGRAARKTAPLPLDKNGRNFDCRIESKMEARRRTPLLQLQLLPRMDYS